MSGAVAEADLQKRGEPGDLCCGAQRNHALLIAISKRQPEAWVPPPFSGQDRLEGYDRAVPPGEAP